MPVTVFSVMIHVYVSHVYFLLLFLTLSVLFTSVLCLLPFGWIPVSKFSHRPFIFVLL